ncbi:Non-catalytic module family DOC2, partial [Piromyces sp. E2]
ECWSERLGYKCCKDQSQVPNYTDKDGEWGVEDNQWCVEPTPVECWSERFGFSCCKDQSQVPYYTDGDGEWGVENNQWCGL